MTHLSFKSIYSSRYSGTPDTNRVQDIFLSWSNVLASGHLGITVTISIFQEAGQTNVSVIVLKMSQRGKANRSQYSESNEGKISPRIFKLLVFPLLDTDGV